MGTPARIGVGIAAAGALWLAGGWLVRALASDETRIRLALERACEGFDAARVDPVLDVLAPDFQDGTTGFQRADVHAALSAAFFQEKDPDTRAFPYRVEVDFGGASIEIEPGEPDAARVAFTATVVDVRGGERREAWSFQVEGRMEEREQGWCFVEMTQRTVSGSPRLRSR
jgi:hypothetical protein